MTELAPPDISGRGLPRTDVALAAAMVVAGAAGGIVWPLHHGPLRVLAATVPLGLGSLVLRRSRCLAVAFIVGVTVVAVASLTTSSGAGALMAAVMIVCYSLGAHADGLTALVGGAVQALAVAGANSVSPPAGYPRLSSVIFFETALVLVPLGVGRIVRSRRDLAERLRDANRHLEVASQNDDGSIEDLRSRLGRSLEATALAGLDAMATHAAISSLADVEAVEGTARHTLGEVRRLLVSLRGEPEPAAIAGSVAELRAKVEAALAATSKTPTDPPHGRWSFLPRRWINAILAIVAVAYGTAMVATSVTHHHPAPPAGIALGLIMGAAVGAMRRVPLAAAVVSVAAAVGYSASVHPVDPLSGLQPITALILGPFALGAAEHKRTRAGIGLAACLAAIPTMLAADPSAHPHAGSVGPAPALILGAFAIGAALQARSRAVDELADAALELDAQRTRRTATAVRAERARVARELHDALAHSLTAILMQATAARRVWHTNPTLAAEHAANLRATLAEAGGELRDLILALSVGETTPVALAQLPALIERARASGMEVELHVVEGRPPTRHGPVDLAGYRIIQEALTNAARHAPGAKVSVEIIYRPGQIGLRVSNGPPLAAAWQINGPGHGIEGMRERARSCGGTLEARRCPEGGFIVAAQLPLMSVTV